MVLKDVAERARILVVLAAPLDADVLGHRDLDVVDIAPVPDRLENAVREAEDHHVLDRLFSQVVVDAVDLRLLEDGVNRAVQFLGALEVVTERLLHYYPLPSLAGVRDARAAKTLDDHREELGKRREIED